jgi:hypothetical protein
MNGISSEWLKVVLPSERPYFLGNRELSRANDMYKKTKCIFTKWHFRIFSDKPAT